ncbi:hypothetical protein E2C01_059436 [Portunus trituberculatus]|uniref:Uncharacterized protein n=1 Tax=Portunus trituberculatus TaxID=210409 RepID=A0A5B7H5C8_PORTR|nr:hypothetical protein [Portunus trituberculatus]
MHTLTRGVKRWWHVIGQQGWALNDSEVDSADSESEDLESSPRVRHRSRLRALTTPVTSV